MSSHENHDGGETAGGGGEASRTAHLGNIRSRNAPHLSLQQRVINPEHQASFAAVLIHKTSGVNDSVCDARRDEVLLRLSAPECQKPRPPARHEKK